MVAHPGDMEEQPMDHPAAATVLPMHPVDNLSLAKGKRTKRRLRAHSPIPFTTLFSSPPMAIDDDGDDLRLSLSPPSDNDNDSTTTEEVETAKCLLLLSRGGFSPKLDDRGSNVRNHHGQALVLPRKNVTTAGGGSTGVYTCKTCSRTFSSFQALGGHRTSHRKMKVEKKSTSATFSDESTPPKFSPNSLSLHLGTAETPPKPSPPPLSHRMHECSYCGAEFTSGQALGGHMRKHRGAPISRSFHTPINTSFEEVEIEEPSKRHKTGLPLDLNLPATDDEIHKQFGAGKSPSRKYEAETLTPLLIDKV